MGGRTDSVKETLLADIFRGTLPPGSALREARLAKEMGVSQATVREALQSLESVGLVTRVANVGTTVVRLTPKNVRQRVMLRSALEAQAALEASERMTPDDFAELERRLGALGSFVQEDNYY